MSEREIDYRRELRSYLTGLCFSLLLTVIPFTAVAWVGWTRQTLLWLIGVMALVQVTVHLRYFLHINLSQQKREDLHLILFSTLLLVIMGGGTIWIAASLAGRMEG